MDWHNVIAHLYKHRDTVRRSMLENVPTSDSEHFADYVIMELCSILASSLNEGLRK